MIEQNQVSFARQNFDTSRRVNLREFKYSGTKLGLITYWNCLGDSRCCLIRAMM